jgi:hypothetical protein
MAGVAYLPNIYQSLSVTRAEHPANRLVNRRPTAGTTD